VRQSILHPIFSLPSSPSLVSHSPRLSFSGNTLQTGSVGTNIYASIRRYEASPRWIGDPPRRGSFLPSCKGCREFHRLSPRRRRLRGLTTLYQHFLWIGRGRRSPSGAPLIWIQENPRPPCQLHRRPQKRARFSSTRAATVTTRLRIAARLAQSQHLGAQGGRCRMPGRLLGLNRLAGTLAGDLALHRQLKRRSVPRKDCVRQVKSTLLRAPQEWHAADTLEFVGPYPPHHPQAEARAYSSCRAARQVPMPSCP